MLTRQEEMFITWWQNNRDRQKKIRNRWFIGLPAGLLLGLPVLLNLFTRWDKHVEMVSGGQMIAVLFAILGIVTFMAIFSVQHKWEMREQLYKELMQKKQQTEPETANQPAPEEKTV